MREERSCLPIHHFIRLRRLLLLKLDDHHASCSVESCQFALLQSCSLYRAIVSLVGGELHSHLVLARFVHLRFALLLSGYVLGARWWSVVGPTGKVLCNFLPTSNA